MQVMAMRLGAPKRLIAVQSGFVSAQASNDHKTQADQRFYKYRIRCGT
jgi:hypothetical protein